MAPAWRWREVNGDGQTAPISVVIPAFNEETALPATLAAVAEAGARLVDAGRAAPEVIVVDNASNDRTSEIAVYGGAMVVYHEEPGIGAARNAGARQAKSPLLFFLDADTLIPAHSLVEIVAALETPGCVGGAPATKYQYRKRLLWLHMAIWKVVAKVRHMAQGVGQFVSADAFRALGGYDETLHMAEDTDFYWRLQRYAAERGETVTYLAQVTIVPSSRRLDEWPVWKTMLYTNPVTTRFLLHSRRFWKGWRDTTVR